jgi:MHS family proline/betaine transporter-like MFS transporter
VDSHEQEVAQAVPQVEETSIRKAIIGAGMGNCVEWFDFAVYGFLATYIGAVFFPSDNPTASLLSSCVHWGGSSSGP